MCGIGGMFGTPDSAIIERMNRLMRHRGPDGNDVWSNENIALGHTRLAIVDLSKRPTYLFTELKYLDRQMRDLQSSQNPSKSYSLSMDYKW